VYEFDTKWQIHVCPWSRTTRNVRSNLAEIIDNSHLQAQFPRIFLQSIQSSPSELVKGHEVTIFSVYTHYEYSKRQNSSFLQQTQHNHRAFFSTKFKAALYIYRHRLLADIFKCFLPLWLDNPSGLRPSPAGVSRSQSDTHTHKHTLGRISSGQVISPT
jgi:hypothetical protein